MGHVVDMHERFWAKVDKTETCWNWTGCTSRGYGRFAVGPGYMVQAHRWSYEQWHGPIAATLVLDHLCKNPLCVNPAHLDPVPQRINVMRGDSMVAFNAIKTHCLNGHEFSVENTEYSVQGRRCRKCAADRKRAKYVPRPRQPRRAAT